MVTPSQEKSSAAARVISLDLWETNVPSWDFFVTFFVLNYHPPTLQKKRAYLPYLIRMGRRASGYCDLSDCACAGSSWPCIVIWYPGSHLLVCRMIARLLWAQPNQCLPSIGAPSAKLPLLQKLIPPWGCGDLGINTP